YMLAVASHFRRSIMRFAVLSSSVIFLAILGCSAASTPTDFEGAGGEGGTTGGTFANGNGVGNGAGGGFTTSAGAGAGGQICSDEAKLIYLLDSNNGLHSFDPPSKTLKTIGIMNCSPNMQPNSMAVDRNAVAWVDYVANNGLEDSAGSLYKVST